VRAVGATPHRNDAEIDVRCEAAVQADFLLARFLA
jgi:hypothetical protein